MYRTANSQAKWLPGSSATAGRIKFNDINEKSENSFTTTNFSKKQESICTMIIRENRKRVDSPEVKPKIVKSPDRKKNAIVFKRNVMRQVAVASNSQANACKFMRRV